MAIDGAREEDDYGAKDPKFHTRRIWIIRELFERGEIDVRALAKEPKFIRAFGRVPKTTQTEDLDAIERTFNNSKWKILAREGSTLRVVTPRQLAYEDLGYEIDSESTREKKAIAQYIVDRLLVETDMVYLSTGTSVYQVAVAILDCPTNKASTILTQNLAIVDLWRHQGGLLPRRQKPIRFRILGGWANFDEAHIDPDTSALRLGGWKCTKTIMSCTALDPTTGEIRSDRQPELKREVLRSAHVGELIIPVTRAKIDEKAGGELIPLPGAKTRNILVTSKLTDDERDSLKRAGFDPHTLE